MVVPQVLYHNIANLQCEGGKHGITNQILTLPYFQIYIIIT